LRGDDAPEVVSQAFCFPAGRPTERRPGDELGVRVIAAEDSVRIESDRLVYGARLTTPGFEAGDDAFSVEPGAGRTVTLRRVDPEAQPSAVLTAINLSDQVRAA
jgi:hypothetical protein